MRGLCGWFSTRAEHDGEAKLRRMLAANPSPPVEPSLKASSQAGLSIFGSAARPRLLEDNGFLLALLGHPRWRKDGRPVEDDVALLRGLRAQGRDALGQISGDFAVAAWDPHECRGLLAIDRIGVHQIVYAKADDALAFASSLDMLSGFPGVQRRLSSQALYDYLFYHVSPGPQTIFEEMLRLQPGHCIEFGKAGVGAPAAYWTMRFREEPQASVTALKDEFLALLETAVGEATDPMSGGTFLSGGTDSSTVTGMLVRATGRSARTFSIGFDVPGYDEMAYARIAARHFGCEPHEYYVTPGDVVDAVPRIAASYDQPFGNASAIPTYYCAKLARESGVSRLLAGDGGDELFGGNERYAKYHLLGLYQKLPRTLREYLVEPVMLGTPGVKHVPLLRKLQSYVQQARPPMPQRYSSYNLLMHLGYENIFTPEFLASIDVDRPQKLLGDAFAPYADASLVNQMMGIDLRFTLADGDLPKVTHMCNLADIDVAFPMLDDRIVEFSQRLSSDLKLRGTQLRWFFKHALGDFLPPEIIRKEKHGFGLPVGAWLVGHKPLFDLAVDSIAPLRQRGIVQPRFIDELLDTHLREHAAYFGNMVWVLMMLGLWLDSRKL
jgi:asparagine synthase (glutamine-hydrolysing)